MGRPAAVSVEDAVAVVKTYIQHFLTNNFPAYTSQVWRDMSAALDGKWSAHNVYINVREDRRSILSIARKAVKVPLVELQKPVFYDSSFDDADSTINDSTASLHPLNISPFEDTNNERGTEIFDLIISQENWDKIKPDGTVKYGHREKHILKRKVWSNVIYEEFWRQYRMPCAFAFKRADITLASDNQTYNLKIGGRCTDKDCLNTFVGTAEVRPDSHGFIIKVKTRDTRFDNHNRKIRRLNGERRKEARDEMAAEGCAVWRKRKAREMMKPGDIIPPSIPSDAVCRQAKMEGFNAKIGVNKEDSRDIIRSIEKLSETREYSGIIRHVSSLPFVAIYSSAAQMHAYNEFCRLRPAVISLDATGSLVAKLNRPDGRKSAHIFLYIIAISFDNKTLTVHQMLSETQETEFIALWLWQWMRIGAKQPKEAVCDYSRALLLAMCTVFNHQTTKAYINICFAAASKPNSELEKPATYIRIDVAHLIHLVCRWKCFEKVTHPCIKSFFVRCVSLMVDCQTHAELQKIFLLTCVVGLQTHDDAELGVSLVRTTKEARELLEDFIAFRGEEYREELEVKVEEKNEKYRMEFERMGIKDYVDNQLDPEDISLKNPKVIPEWKKDLETGEPIVQWVRRQLAKAMEQKSGGQNLNPFFLPDFIQTLSQLVKEYPLWTAAALPYDAPHSTSAPAEAAFKDLKTRTFGNLPKPIRIDKFIRVHALDFNGATLLFSAMLIDFATKLQSTETTTTKNEFNARTNTGCSSSLKIVPLDGKTACDDSDIWAQENWRNKAEKRFPENFSSSDDESMPKNHNVVDISWLPISNNITIMTEDFKAASNFDDSQEKYKKTTLEPDIEMDTSLSDKVLLSKSASVFTDHWYCENHEDLNMSQDWPVSVKHMDVDTFHNAVGQKYSSDVQPNASDAIAFRIMNDFPAKPKEKKPISSQSKYFRSHPEIRQQNLLISKKQKICLLQNGNLCQKPMKIDGETFFVRNTCGFDSIVQILMTAAIDHQQYASILRESENRTLKLALMILKNGANSKAFYERAAILKNWCLVEANVEANDRVLSYNINAWNSIRNTVENLFESAPSVRKRETCSHCTGKEYSCTLIAPNHQIIGREGFGSLEKALDFRECIRKIKCQKKNCVGLYTLYSTPSFHLFIELDIRPTTKFGIASQRLKCRLRQIPVKVRLRQQDETYIEYW